MEYVRLRGDYSDVPYDEIVTNFKSVYSRWMALRSGDG